MTDNKCLKKYTCESTKEAENMDEYDVEGYRYCDSTKQKCLYDCSFGPSPALSRVD